LLNLLRLLLYR